ncbi:MAG: hypothetical protein AAGF75_05890, partial [Cyanobacteria bacterium P01_H01_bin.130]
NPEPPFTVTATFPIARPNSFGDRLRRLTRTTTPLGIYAIRVPIGEWQPTDALTDGLIDELIDELNGRSQDFSGTILPLLFVVIECIDCIEDVGLQFSVIGITEIVTKCH